MSHGVRSIVIALTTLIVLPGSPLFGNDFPEPLRIDDPLLIPETRDEALAGGYSELAWNYHALASTDNDRWNLHTTSSYTPLRLANDFALALYYGAWTLVAPTLPSDAASNAIGLRLAALEFDYGLTAAARLGPLHLTMEYSRTSQHPWVARFSQVSTDSVKLGLVLPQLQCGDFNSDWFLRGGLVDLFDFWHSVLPKPRLDGKISLGTELDYQVLPWLSLIGNGSADWNFTRSGSSDFSGQGEAGCRFSTGPAGFDLYLEISATPDSEEILHQATPQTLAGFGLRFFLSWP